MALKAYARHGDYKSAEGSGYRQLAADLILGAVQNLKLPVDDPSRKRKVKGGYDWKEGMSAVEYERDRLWVFGKRGQGALTFGQACSILNICPEKARKKIAMFLEDNGREWRDLYVTVAKDTVPWLMDKDEEEVKRIKAHYNADRLKTYYEKGY